MTAGTFHKSNKFILRICKRLSRPHLTRFSTVCSNCLRYNSSVAFRGDPLVIECSDPAELDTQLDSLPSGPAVFAIWAAEGEPYVSRTNVLRRRLKRLLRERTGSRLLNLRNVCKRVEYWPVASKLAGTLVLYDVAREYVPEQYAEILHLRMPPYVKLVTGIDFPRTQITTRIGGSAGSYFGPFRTRGSAEQFEHEFLDLFQIRRCQEDLEPSPDHPGCIYGEMNMCLRPCQQVVGIAEYASEASRVGDFLRTGGKMLLQSAEAARDRLSAELQFEDAAREHKRVERINQVLALRDELVSDVDQLFGVAITASGETGAVALWFLLQGAWTPVRVVFGGAGRAVAVDGCASQRSVGFARTGACVCTRTAGAPRDSRTVVLLHVA